MFRLQQATRIALFADVSPEKRTRRRIDHLVPEEVVKNIGARPQLVKTESLHLAQV